MEMANGQECKNTIPRRHARRNDRRSAAGDYIFVPIAGRRRGLRQGAADAVAVDAAQVATAVQVEEVILDKSSRPTAPLLGFG
eukprot:scaffold89210_cov29-Tisochrysis_lutea.AAC.1